MSGDCIRGSSWQLLFLSVPIPSLLSPLLPSSCFPRAFPASNHWDFITHTQNCCSVHPPPARMSSFAEEERAEHLPWLCMEEESKTDKKKKKRQKLSSLFKLCLVTWVLVIALICTWGFLAGEGFFSACHFFVAGCFQTHYSWHLFTQAGSSLHQGHKMEIDLQRRCVM